LELRQLRAFVALVELGHYGRAAASLNLTQPAITQRIQALEAEFGVQLLVRNAREVRMTPAGEEFIKYAKGLIQLEDRASGAMADHAAGLVGRLRISYLTLWDVGLPANIVAEFRRRYPTIKLEMTTGYSQMNIERLESGEVDFAFVGASIGAGNGIAVRALDRHELVLVMTPTHRFMQMTFVPIESLRGEPMIAVSSGVNAPLAAASSAWLTRHIGEPPNIVRLEPPDQIAGALSQAGKAVAFMTEHRASRAKSDGLDYRPLKPRPLIEYGVAYARDNQSPALANLLEIVDKLAPPLPAQVPGDSELIWTPPLRDGRIAD
jgi:DNA-binding transcriptional LysR family regulator